MSTQRPKPNRRWLRFSLLTLLILMTVATVAFGRWVHSRRQQAQENRDSVAATAGAIEEVVAEIEKLNGKVYSEYVKRREQTWLERLFDDPGGAENAISALRVKSVDLSFTQVTDTDLEHLKGLKSLQVLDLEGTQISSAGLEHVKVLTELRVLKLSGPNFTDEGLEHLKPLTHLEVLWLRDTKITDAGLKHLRGRQKLIELWLSNTNVSDEGVKKLQQTLPNCLVRR